MSKNLILEVDHLKTQFQTDKGLLTAVDGVSFSVREGEIVGIVGESGCGKSVTSQSILRLYDEKYQVKYGGKINFKGNNLLDISEQQMRKIRGNKISMIFQDASSALNPVFTIGYQIVESIRLHQKVSKKAAYEIAKEMLSLTGIPDPEKRLHEYPHQLSGGMKQRAMISVALSCRPTLLIADEPTTALDVTIQAQILDLIVNLNKELGMGVLFITHDLGVVAEICNRVLVMYLGQIVEVANVKDIFDNPLHPYTKGLMKSIPTLDSNREEPLNVIKGSVPSLDKTPKGCRFASRCEFATGICHESMPELEDYEISRVRCWHADKINSKAGVGV
ncbi:ABC transporter ATP-binding protein [Neobacillus niacini]|uniref:ABC transporter ATP-binding protein n=1 Tax=Neobacillus niacini TaxID=86668 RepID=UPI00300341A5